VTYLYEVVDGQPVLSGQPAIASPQSQADDDGEIVSKIREAEQTLRHRSIAKIRGCLVHN